MSLKPAMQPAPFENLSAHAEISVLFTDVNMPGEMDGLQLSAIVRQRWPQIKIIVTSGKFYPGFGGLLDTVFIPKPYDIRIISATIEQLVN